VIFFRLHPRDGYASYWPQARDGAVADLRVPENFRGEEIEIAEYLGDPPRKPGKRGSLLKSAYSFFVRADALPLISESARGNLLTHPTIVVGRESEEISQFWVTNFVDCLDTAKTVVSPMASPKPGKIGVIKRPVFDESRWDGSDLFVVPQDPSYCFFVSERFVERWRAAKFKGAMFSRYLMDPEAIEC
jgi:hypothetical protein